MSISVICPSCQATDRLADSMNGKNVSCKECLEVFLVRGKSAARDSDEDEETRTARRPAKRASRDDDDEDSSRPAQRKRASRDDDDDEDSSRPAQRKRASRDDEDDRPTQRRTKRSSRDDDDDDRPQRRRRPRKKQSGGVPTGVIVGGTAVAVLCVAGVGLGVWAFTPPKKPQVASSDTSPPPNLANTNPPPVFPAANTQNTQVQTQTPTQGQTQMPMPGQNQMPPPQTQMPGQGGLAVELSNGNVSGFGIRMEVTVNYRFTSGNPTGRHLFLLIKATKAGGLRQSYYIAELKSIQGNMQGTIGAGGMTFGIEHGPFEMFMAEGPANAAGPLINDKDLTKISNVVTVAGRQNTIPGPPGRMRP